MMGITRGPLEIINHIKNLNEETFTFYMNNLTDFELEGLKEFSLIINDMAAVEIKSRMLRERARKSIEKGWINRKMERELSSID